jgi:transcriptional regulator with XRE-family HTH domain
MPVQLTPIREADVRARRQLQDCVADMRNARLAAGLSQASVARAIGCAHSRISDWERARASPGLRMLARWAAAVGLELRLAAYRGGAPLRDAAQLRLLARARGAIGGPWAWATEVAVTAAPLERRAFDAVLSRDGIRIGLEAVTRLTDVQAQVRALTLKRTAGGLDCMVIVLANTRHNREALLHASPTMDAAFPLRTRAVLQALRQGRAPGADGLMLV